MLNKNRSCVVLMSRVGVAMLFSRNSGDDFIHVSQYFFLFSRSVMLIWGGISCLKWLWKNKNNLHEHLIRYGLLIWYQLQSILTTFPFISAVSCSFSCVKWFLFILSAAEIGDMTVVIFTRPTLTLRILWMKECMCWLVSRVWDAFTLRFGTDSFPLVNFGGNALC